MPGIAHFNADTLLPTVFFDIYQYYGTKFQYDVTKHYNCVKIE